MVHKAPRLEQFKEQVRQVFADYYASEGCSCCRNEEEHDKAKKKLAELLDVPMYEDGSGPNFWPFRTPKKG